MVIYAKPSFFGKPYLPNHAIMVEKILTTIRTNITRKVNNLFLILTISKFPPKNNTRLSKKCLTRQNIFKFVPLYSRMRLVIRPNPYYSRYIFLCSISLHDASNHPTTHTTVDITQRGSGRQKDSQLYLSAVIVLCYKH